jgi:monoterpene epsilon-lactone hydrolase
MPSREHAAMVEQIVKAGHRAPTTLPSPDELAAGRARERALIAPDPPADVRVEHTVVGRVPCVSVEPAHVRSDLTVVYFHGGGYVWSTASAKLQPAIEIARAVGARCLSVDYRRGPEDPHPAAVDDAVAVYRSMLADGIDATRVAFAGESAGGGLVVCALLAARDAGLPLPAAGICISPWTDLAVTGASAATADDPLVDAAGLRVMADLYLCGADPTSPTASPLYADLRGLPPLLVQVGTREALLDDARRFVQRARAAGVDTTLVEFPDVIHMWVVFGPEIPESVEAFRQASDFLRRHIPRQVAEAPSDLDPGPPSRAVAGR